MSTKKRSLAEGETPQLGSRRRRSTRLSSVGKKSAYFEDQDDVDDLSDEEEEQPPRKATKSAAGASRSRPRLRANVSDDEDAYEDGDMGNDDDDDDDDDHGDSDGADDGQEPETPPPRKAVSARRGRGRPPKASSAQHQARSSTQARTPGSGARGRGRPKKTDRSTPSGAKRAGNTAPDSGEDGADDNDDDDDDDDDDDGELKVTFIPLPQLRDTNGVEYEDTIVHPNTLLFLGDLKANNKRSWLKMHDPEYRRSLKDWESFVETLTGKIIEADDTIPELPIKDVIFRIYRDIRFSKDPTPYKPHYSAAWSRTGRKGPYACYYVHVEPGNCLVGGGLWHPEAAALARLRASVDERPHRIRRVLTDPEFVRVFLPHAAGESGKKAKAKKGETAEDRILRAFAEKNQENALKTKPKGFNPDHRDINLLKLRNYTIGRRIPDEELQGDDAQEKIMETIRAMVPFVTFLNNTVMPDPGVDSDSDEEGGDEERSVEDEDEVDDD